jgi:hypothetical protein
VTPSPRYRTDSRLWLVVGVGVFVALGFFDPSGGYGKLDGSLWATVAVIVAAYDRINVSGLLVPVAFYAAVLAGAAALVGWAVQAVVVVIRVRRTATDSPAG